MELRRWFSESFWLREPLLHFLCLGGLLFLGYAFFGEDELQAENRILISRGELQSLEAQWNKRRGRMPNPEELQQLLDQVIRDRILAREARALGLDQHDSIVERRLAQKMEFLFTDLIDAPEPDRQQLQQFLEQNLQRYRQPPRMSFAHIYFNPDKHQDELADAVLLLTSLPASLAGVDVDQLGDRFLLPSNYDRVSPAEVRRAFGKTFANELFANPAPGWRGPLVSGYGVHLVFIESVAFVADPVLEDIAPRLISDWSAQQMKQQNKNFYNALLEKYTIIVESVDDAKD